MSRRFASVARAIALLGGLAVLGTLVVPAGAHAQGCAMCKTAIDGANDALAAAFNTSTLFLIAMPYSLVAAVGAWIALGARRRQRRPVEDSAETLLR
jgi:hypothetical protein